MMALTFRAFKHANSSSKSFVIGPLEYGPLFTEVLDCSDAGVWGHGSPELAIRAFGVLK
jgi:hypothetical protein